MNYLFLKRDEAASPPEVSMVSFNTLTINKHIKKGFLTQWTLIRRSVTKGLHNLKLKNWFMLLGSMTHTQKSCAKYYSFTLPGIQVMKKHFQIFCLGKRLARYKETENQRLESVYLARLERQGHQ